MVRRNGEVDGPFSDESVLEIARLGYRDVAVRLNEDGAEWTPILYSPFASQLPDPPPPSQTGRVVIIIAALGAVLLAGCGFIVAEPVIALAIFFVGIPFVLFVLWMAGLLLSPKPR